MTRRFETSNRRLEEFFFAHDVRFDRYYRGLDGITVWVYELDTEGQRMLEEYRALQQRRLTRKAREGVR